MMIKKSLSLLLALMLIVASIPLTAVSVSAADGDTLTVTAKSNFAPDFTQSFDPDTEQITVTWWIQSEETMINAQWVMKYDNTVLKVDQTPGINMIFNDNGSVQKNMIFRATDGVNTVTNMAPRVLGGSGIICNLGTDPNGYPLVAIDGESRIPFISVTFNPLEGAKGETVVELDLQIMQTQGPDDAREDYFINDSVIVDDTIKYLPESPVAVYAGPIDPDYVPEVQPEQPTTVAPTEPPTTAEPTTMPDITASGTSGDCTWQLENGTLTISGNGAMKDYSSYAPWYAYRDDIYRIVIEYGVTTIGNHAFNRISNATSVTIPGSVTSIGNLAFDSCTGLQSVAIPSSVKSIGWGSFEDCIGLQSVTIPGSVTSIGNFAFDSCTGLQSVTIPNSVKGIGSEAFYNCTGLQSVTIPGSVSAIGDWAFGFKSDYKLIPGFTMYGYTDTDAEQYAKEYGLTFVALDEEPLTELYEEPTTKASTEETTIEPSYPDYSNDIFVLAGSYNFLISGWMADPDNYVMRRQSDGSYAITVTDVQNGGGLYQFKVVRYVDGSISNTVWYGYDGTDLNVDFMLSGDGDVTVTFNPNTMKITVTGLTVIDPVFDIQTVHVAGDGKNGFLNSEQWNTSGNIMQMIAPQIYEITYLDVDANIEYQFKFLANGTWDINWGAMKNADNTPNKLYAAEYNSYGNIFFTTDSESESVDITIRFDLSNWDVVSKQGATYKVTVTPHGELPTEPITEPTTEPIEKQPVRLNITKLPDKTSYAYGEALDLSGMQVMAVYDDYSIETVTDYAVTPLQNAIGEQTVTLSYEGMTASFNVTVGKGELTGLTLENAPNKRRYQVGEALDLSGIILVAEYNSGYTEYVTDCEAEANLNEEGYAVPVNLSYGGKSVSYTVRVTAPVLMGIYISKIPNKTQYLPGEAFDKTGMTVTAFYNDGTERQVTDYTVSPMDAQGGVQQLTVSWQDKTAPLTVVVYALGDVNKDGVITVADVTLLQKSLVELTALDESERQLADFNQDGEISIADATLIQIQISQ